MAAVWVGDDEGFGGEEDEEELVEDDVVVVVFFICFLAWELVSDGVGDHGGERVAELSGLLSLDLCLEEID